MKKNISILLLSLMFGAVSFAQTKIVKPIKVKTDVSSEKHLSSSILVRSFFSETLAAENNII